MENPPLLRLEQGRKKRRASPGQGRDTLDALRPLLS
jgi:hypothetical protein